MSATSQNNKEAENGVEKEAASRFIDYTTATQWEDLSSTCERALTKWLRSKAKTAASDEEKEETVEPVPLEYMGYNFTLLLIDECRAEAAREVHLWYRGISLTSCALLVRTNDWLDLTPSEMKSIFSALVCGCQASETNLPVFLASSSLERLSHSETLLGYQICQPSSGSRLRFRDHVRHFESTLLEGIDGKHDLCFLDGLLKHFKHNIRFFSSPEEVSVAVDETFAYAHTDATAQNQYWRNESLLQSTAGTKATLSSSDWVLSNLRRHRPNCSHRSSFTQQLCVDLKYSNLNLANLLDNASYTTLIPSKQPPENWSVSVVFRKETKKSSGSRSIYSLGASSCIRRILGLYIYGKATEPKARLIDLKLDDLSIQRATSVASILSAESRQALEKLVVRVVDETDEAKSSFSEQLFYLQYLFDVPGQSLQNEKSTEVNAPTWVSLLAILVGCSRGHLEYTAQLWQECLNRLHRSFHYKDVGSFHFFKSADKKNKEEAADSGDPLWARTLWNEDDGQPELPDIRESIVKQKLQMLRFCTATKDSDPTATCTYSPPEGLDFSKIVTPRLVRRVPATHDSTATNSHLAQSLHSSSSGGDATSDVASLRVQLKLRLPAVISDIRAFKAANPSADYTTFHAWYRLADLQMELDGHDCNFAELWEGLDECEARSQRPLFHAEAEAEKALTFLQALTPLQFSAEMLTASLHTTFGLIRDEVAEWTMMSDDTCAVDANQVKIDLGKLETKVEDAITKIRQDVAEFGSTAADASVSQATLVMLDDVCLGFDELESFCAKAAELDVLLSLPDELSAPRARAAGFPERSRLVVALARHGVAKASSPNEAKRLCGLARAFSRGSRPAHIWHSTDGRELAPGDRKTCVVSANNEQLVATIEHSRIRLSKVFC